MIDAVGLAKKDGKNYKWLGRPSIAHADNANRMRRRIPCVSYESLENLSMTLTQKKTSLIRLIRRVFFLRLYDGIGCWIGVLVYNEKRPFVFGRRSHWVGEL